MEATVQRKVALDRPDAFGAIFKYEGPHIVMPTCKL